MKGVNGMKVLNGLLIIISALAMISFIAITLSRMKTIRTQAKKFGMRKEVTDPLLYWFSYISAFLIIVIKIIVWFSIGKNMTTKHLILSEILPTIALIVFTRTIGKSMIMRAETSIYVNNLVTEIKDIHKLVKKDNKWTLFTTTGQYPVTLSSTTVYKIADITGAKIEKENDDEK
jgi:hypothetical protein